MKGLIALKKSEAAQILRNDMGKNDLLDSALKVALREMETPSSREMGNMILILAAMVLIAVGVLCGISGVLYLWIFKNQEIANALVPYTMYTIFLGLFAIYGVRK